MPYPAKTSPRAILEAALVQLEREGTDGFSVRAVAGALGLAPNALYRYYPDRDALLAALADEGARRLLTELRGAADGEVGLEAVRRVAHAYLSFAGRHPAVYGVYMTCLPRAGEGETTGHEALWRFVVELLGELVLAHDEAPRAAVALWGYLHGMVGLEEAGIYGTGKPREAAGYGLEALLAGLARGPV